MYYKVRIFFIVALCAATSWIVARKVYRYYYTQKPALVITGNDDDARYKTGKPLSYDYARLISLVEKTIELKKDFYQQFFSETVAHRTIGRKEAKELLADLYREKVRLVKFDRQMRVRFKGDVPPKKKRTVRHYQRIIDKCISDLESILRQL